MKTSLVREDILGRDSPFSEREKPVRYFKNMLKVSKYLVDFDNAFANRRGQSVKPLHAC